MANQVFLTVNDDQEYVIDAKNCETNYFIRLQNAVANIKYDITNAIVNILFINDFNEQITINDQGKIDNQSEVEVMFIDLINHDYLQSSSIDVCHGSSLSVITKFLTFKKRQIKMLYRNIDPQTNIKIDNSCVSLDQSDLQFECIGKIVNGAKFSKNMQASRCLTIDYPKQSLIEPVLLIDENEVEAAHALSSGTIDPDVLYYLNSRGISYKEAMNLIIHSYLLPQVEQLAIFTNGEELLEELSRKVVF